MLAADPDRFFGRTTKVRDACCVASMRGCIRGILLWQVEELPPHAASALPGSSGQSLLNTLPFTVLVTQSNAGAGCTGGGHAAGHDGAARWRHQPRTVSGESLLVALYMGRRLLLCWVGLVWFLLATHHPCFPLQLNMHTSVPPASVQAVGHAGTRHPPAAHRQRPGGYGLAAQQGLRSVACCCGAPGGHHAAGASRAAVQSVCERGGIKSPPMCKHVYTSVPLMCYSFLTPAPCDIALCSGKGCRLEPAHTAGGCICCATLSMVCVHDCWMWLVCCSLVVGFLHKCLRTWYVRRHSRVSPSIHHCLCHRLLGCLARAAA